MLAALAAFPDLPAGRQTLECSIMDLADDIAYSLHDVEDFHRSGVLQFSPVSGEFRSWITERRPLAAMSTDELRMMGRWPGSGLEQLRRRLIDKDDWMLDEDHFADPYRFDVRRHPNPQVGYGAGGPHFCLGANLARREITMAFRELHRQVPDIHASGAPAMLQSGFIHGIKRLPATWTPPT